MNFLQRSLPAQNQPPPPSAKHLAGLDWTTRRAEWLIIRPQLAARWLAENNARNRHVKDNNLMVIGLDILAGRWQVTGEPIIFGWDGNLNDGQHRLMACVEAKMDIESLVVFGIAPKAQDVTDVGSTRTLGDQLNLADVPNYCLAGAVGNLVLVHSKHGIRYWQDRTKHPTKAEAGEFVKLDAAGPKRIQRAIHQTRGISGKLGIGGRFLGFMCYEICERHPQLADRFFDELRDGSNLSIDNPVHHLRERLIANNQSKARLRETEVLALIIKAWNAYVEGRPVRNLRWRTDGPKQEQFPEIA